MNQYRLTQMMEGQEIEEGELGLNALVGFATGNWGEIDELNDVWQGLRMTLGQISWSDVVKGLVPNQNQNNTQQQAIDEDEQDK